MDILRKELNSIYKSQHLEKEILDNREIERCKIIAEGLIAVNNGCSVITDAASDHTYLFIGSLGDIIGVIDVVPYIGECNSSDEDIIYESIHPEDLVDKRMLEYEFFKHIDSYSGKDKVNYQATCRIRMGNGTRGYYSVINSTQIISPSPEGKIWLILCTYQLDSRQKWDGDICPVIKNNKTGEVINLSFRESRSNILSKREKEILHLIKGGLASKQIANSLKISIHTVNRHRQNIIEKLSVANSIEAITAAESMGLL